MSDLRLLAILENIDKLEGAVSDEFLRNLCKEAAKEIAELNALRLRQKQELVAVVVDVYDTPGLLWFCQHPLKRGDRLYTAPQPTARREWQELTDEQIDSACLAYEAGAAAEREKCAKKCESYIAAGIGKEMADAIRAMSNE